MKWRRRVRTLLSLLLIAGLSYAVWMWNPTPPQTLPLAHVIDGDSLVVRQDDKELTIRLTGLDAVEYRQMCTKADGTPWPCGREARSALETIVGKGPVHCVIEAEDKYRRTLASCNAGSASQGVDLSAAMIRDGWAVATSDAHLFEQHAAEAARRGIWQGKFDRPADWRAEHQRGAKDPQHLLPDL